MPKLVVLHHAHHPDENLYKLIYAEEQEHKSIDEKDKEVSTVVHINHQNIVWDSRDPKWKDRSDEDIAKEQLQIVKEAIKKQASDFEEHQKEAENRLKNAKPLGTHGQAL